MVVSLLCGFTACGSASSTVLVDRGTIEAPDPSSCESAPLPQFNLNSITYIARQSTDIVAKADLGAVLGTQKGDIPEGLLRCESVQLEEGQGSLAPGAHVYAISGIDPSIAIAAEVGTDYMKLYRV
jgi:hypothetical protein